LDPLPEDDDAAGAGDDVLEDEPLSFDEELSFDDGVPLEEAVSDEDEDLRLSVR
jgi:hypothetical protein